MLALRKRSNAEVIERHCHLRRPFDEQNETELIRQQLAYWRGWGKTLTVRLDAIKRTVGELEAELKEQK